ncbi:MAG: dihydroorotase [Rhodospirillaceae bacterium]|nr:dihydroorotase [Rhodospirillaceae bacterium]
MTSPASIKIRRPDDWHVHLRDDEMLAAVAPYTANVFARAIVMPNLKKPVVLTSDAVAYRKRILKATDGTGFIPLMTAYLTDATNPSDLEKGFNDGVFVAAKLYPAGATTNSESGVTDINKISSVIEKMEELSMPLLVHGEVTSPDIDVFDREAVFIDRVLEPLLKKHQGLKVVFEHITTSQAVQFVRAAGPRVGATVTIHHMIINRSDMFKGGIRPHLYCLPVAKREQHRLALVEAATSGEKCFFLGTDTAPHSVNVKESACGCAGIFSAPSAIELYAQAFDEAGALENLESFASLNGPAFYGMDANVDEITLTRESWKVPEVIEVPGTGGVAPFMAGKEIQWKIS